MKGERQIAAHHPQLAGIDVIFRQVRHGGVMKSLAESTLIIGEFHQHERALLLPSTGAVPTETVAIVGAGAGLAAGWLAC